MSRTWTTWRRRDGEEIAGEYAFVADTEYLDDEVYDAVCFHGQKVCPFCGTSTVAPWRQTLHHLLSRPTCPSCGRRLRRHQPCARCLTAGHTALTLFNEGAA